MADYRVQLSATKGTWVGDQAHLQLTATVRPAHRNVPFPEGKKINFHFESGVFPKELNSVGVAYLTVKYSRVGIFTAGAILGEDPDARDTCEVIIPVRPEKAPEKSPEEETRDKAKLSAETEEFRKRKREAKKKERPKEKKPVKLVVEKSGYRGKYTFIISVKDEEEKTLPNTGILIFPAPDATPQKEATGPSGTYQWDLSFQEEEKFVRISLPGVQGQEWSGWLTGPRSEPRIIIELTK